MLIYSKVRKYTNALGIRQTNSHYFILITFFFKNVNKILTFYVDKISVVKNQICYSMYFLRKNVFDPSFIFYNIQYLKMYKYIIINTMIDTKLSVAICLIKFLYILYYDFIVI